MTRAHVTTYRLGGEPETSAEIHAALADPDYGPVSDQTAWKEVGTMTNTWTIHEATGKRITGAVEETGVDEKAPDYADQQWRIELQCEGRTMGLDYYGGSMASTPTVAEVVETLDLDASYADYTFDEFCAELGYDTDSRSAEKTWKAVKAQSKRFARLLGN